MASRSPLVFVPSWAWSKILPMVWPTVDERSSKEKRPAQASSKCIMAPSSAPFSRSPAVHTKAAQTFSARQACKTNGLQLKASGSFVLMCILLMIAAHAWGMTAVQGGKSSEEDPGHRWAPDQHIGLGGRIPVRTVAVQGGKSSEEAPGHRWAPDQHIGLGGCIPVRRAAGQGGKSSEEAPGHRRAPDQHIGLGGRIPVRTAAVQGGKSSEKAPGHRRAPDQHTGLGGCIPVKRAAVQRGKSSEEAPGHRRAPDQHTGLGGCIPVRRLRVAMFCLALSVLVAWAVPRGHAEQYVDDTGSRKAARRHANKETALAILTAKGSVAACQARCVGGRRRRWSRQRGKGGSS